MTEPHQQEGQPLFSIVICTFQRPHLVSRAVRSALAQEHDRFEVIVVDDGTTTGDVKAVLAEFRDPRLRLFRNEENRGLALSTNRGIENARGEFVVFLDDDDELCTGFLEHTERHLRSSRDGFCWCGITEFSPEGEVIRQRLDKIEAQDLPSRQMIAALIGSGFGLTVRRECLRATGGYDPELSTCTDVDLFLRLVQGPWSWSCVPWHLVNVHRQTERLTLQRATNGKSLLYIVEKHRQFLDSHPRLRSVLYWEMGTLLADAGQRRHVREIFSRYLLKAPADRRGWTLLLSNELRHIWLGRKILGLYRWFYHRFLS